MRRRITIVLGVIVPAGIVSVILSGCAGEAPTALPTTTTTTEPTTTTTAESTTTTTTEPTTTTTTTTEETTTTEPTTTTTTEPTTTTTEATTTTEGTTTTEAESQDVYAIGETAHTSVFDVTVHQVVSPWQSSNEFETPQPGHHFVAVEASLTNVEGGELATWSSLLGAELTDSQGRPWDVAFAGMDLPQLDGDVGIGMTRRGWIVFEVADDATGLILRLKGELTATGSLFDLGV